MTKKEPDSMEQAHKELTEAFQNLFTAIEKAIEPYKYIDWIAKILNKEERK